MSEVKWCPTQSGKFTGYIPEYRISEGRKVNKWKRVPAKIKETTSGIPFPLQHGGILETIHLFGYSQAQALGHCFAAHWESRRYEIIEIRIVEYEIIYQIKARKKGSLK